jgi:hypothetical protein
LGTVTVSLAVFYSGSMLTSSLGGAGGWLEKKLFYQRIEGILQLRKPAHSIREPYASEIAAMPVQLGTNKWLDLIRQAARSRN